MGELGRDRFRILDESCVGKQRVNVEIGREYDAVLLSPVDNKVFHWGKNTRDAMQAGVFWAALGAIQEIVHRLQAELRQDCDIVVTGGDIARLLPHLNLTVRHEPYLVLAGLAMANTDPTQ